MCHCSTVLCPLPSVASSSPATSQSFLPQGLPGTANKSTSDVATILAPDKASSVCKPIANVRMTGPAPWFAGLQRTSVNDLGGSKSNCVYALQQRRAPRYTPLARRSLRIRIAASGFVLVFTSLLLTPTTHAQDLPDVANGLTPYASFHRGEVDNINLLNGSMNLRIPLFSLPQLGRLQLSYSIYYNPPKYSIVQTCTQGEGGSDGELIGGGSGNCVTQVQRLPTRSGTGDFSPYIALDQGVGVNGVERLLPNTGDGVNAPYQGQYLIENPDGSETALVHTSQGFRSMDGSGKLLVIPPPGNGWPALIGGPLPQGTTVITQDGVSHVVSYPTRMTDPNGNTITTSTDGSATDSVGRIIPSTNQEADPGGCPNLNAPFQSLVRRETWTVPGPGGTQRYTLCYATINIHTDFLGGTNTQVVHDIIGPQTVLQAVVLPNQQYWGFIYDSADPNNQSSIAYGALTQLILPTGGTISYKMNWTGGFCNLESTNNNRIPVITSKTISPGDGSQQVWKYNGAPIYGTEYTVFKTVTSPENDDTVHTFTNPSGSTWSCDFKETEVATYQGSSGGGAVPLLDIKTDRFLDIPSPFLADFPSSPSIAHLPLQVTQTWQDGSSQVATHQYDSGFQATELWCTPNQQLAGNCGSPGPVGTYTLGNVIDQQEFDYNGALLQHKVNTYWWQNHPDYFTANLTAIPSTKQILDGQGQQFSLQTYTYDESAYSPTAIAGLPTTIDTWLNTGPDVITHTGWTASGMKSFMIDAKGNTNSRGHTTDYLYGQCSGSKVSDIYNALNQHTSGTYDCAAGLLTGYTDANSKTSSFGYDAMGRIQSAHYPDGGSTTFNYDDVNRTVARTITATPNPSQTTTVVFDGLGREIHRYVSDSPQPDTVDTTYDVDGHVASVSNPYRSLSDPTYGITSFTYDALGRKLLQCQPDNGNNTPCVAANTYLQWSYSGNVTTFYDESRNSWQNTNDALGRLTDVIEPGNLKTHYTYDALGNLWDVTQNGASGETPRTRSFTYDSLSRLICASNPENSQNACPTSATTPLPAGVVGYSYDPNGNLSSKTDARGVTTTYAYDRLNRLTGKKYSGEPDPVHPTPSTCYLYGSDANSNTIGRLVSEWTQPGNCPSAPTGVPASAVSWKSNLSYDPMGRISSEQQCALAPCSTPSPLQYLYDLAGNITYSTNGLANSQSPQVGWTNSYDAAGRLKTIVSNWTDTTHPATLFQADSTAASALGVSAAYSPFGGLAAALYGIDSTANTVALSDTRSYDKRLRLTSKSVLGAAALIVTTANASMSPATFDLSSNAIATIHVDCNSACGQVDIKVDASDLGTQSLDNNGNVTISSSTFPASARSIGSHTLTVLYLGNGSYASSLGSTTYTVTTQQTTVDFTMNPTTFTTAENPQVLIHVNCNSACGQVALTVDGHDWIPGYDVDGNGYYPSYANIWFWQSPYLTAGTHTITANYLGNSTYAPSSKSITVTINPIGTQQTGVSLSIDPPAFTTVEDAVASVHVGCNSACGQVQFTIDGNHWVIWSLDANGYTSADTFWWYSPYITQGTHTLTANYLGNSTYAPSSDSKTITVNPIGTQPVSVNLSVNPGTTFTTSDDFTFPVHVGCNSRCGFVQVTVDGNQWVFIQLDQNGDVIVGKSWAGNAYFTPGTHTVRAHFFGNSTYAPSDSSDVTVTVTP
jgi:YD repeat-containing protein